MSIGPRHVIFVTGDTEGRYFRSLLGDSRADATVHVASSASALDTIAEALDDALALTRLICFSTDIIVPAKIIERLGPVPYNVHVGPPEYPGSHPASFAVYEGADVFGVTLHELDAAVDDGPIAAVERFDIESDITAGDLNGRAYQAALALFSRHAAALLGSSESLPRSGDAWSKPVRTHAEALRLAEISAGMDETEADRRRRAFGVLRASLRRENPER